MHHHALIGAKYIQTGVRPLPRGVCDMPTLLLDYQKIESFRRCVYCVEWADDHCGTWFDANRSTFDKICTKNDFLYFCSQWPWPLIFRPIKRYITTKLEVSTWLSCFEKIGGVRRTGRRTRCNTLMRSPREGCIQVEKLKHREFSVPVLQIGSNRCHWCS